MKYNLRRQLAKGQRWEQYLDSLFADQFSIIEATRDQQRLGIDRIFIGDDGRQHKIEYKADERAATTGNAFVETISVDTVGKLGWAELCEADYLLYYIAGVGPIYIIRPRDLRAKLEHWRQWYPERRIANDGYHTIGLLVPLKEFGRLAVAIHPG
jgi:hypothetical protein